MCKSDRLDVFCCCFYASLCSKLCAKLALAFGILSVLRGDLKNSCVSSVGDCTQEHTCDALAVVFVDSKLQ